MGRLPDVFRVFGSVAPGDGGPTPARLPASPVDGGGGASERVRWGRVVLVALSGVVSHVFGRATIAVLLPAMSDDLQLSDSMAGAVGSANMGAYFVSVAIVTFAAGRVEPFTLLRTGIAVSTVGLVVVGLAPGAPALLVGTALAGLGGGGIWLTAPVIASEDVPAARRGAALGTLTATMGAAGIGVPLATTALRGIVGDETVWRPVWLVEAAVSVLLLVALTLFVQARRTERIPTTGGLSALRRIGGWKRAVVAYMAFAYTTSSFATFLGLALERDHDFSRFAATLVFSGMGAGSIVGALAFGRLSDRLGRPATMATVMAITTSTALVLGSNISIAAIMVGAVVVFGGASFAYPSLTATFVRDHVSDRTFPAVFGAMTMFYGPAAVAGPAASGWLANSTGNFTATYWVIAAMALVSCLCMATVRRSRVSTPLQAPLS